MDISGVDVDSLSDEEILYLFSDAVDTNQEEIAVLNTSKNIDKNMAVDEDNDVIFINGKSVNIDDLTDDEILVLYDEVIDSNDLLAYDKTAHKCTVDKKTFYLKYASSYGSYSGVYMYCFTTYGGMYISQHCQDGSAATAKNCRVFAIANGNGSCYFKCSAYMNGRTFCKLSYAYKTYFTSSTLGVYGALRYTNLCK
ncbi:MAG: hypothetical protein LUH05_10295 [Candidatus Gastranaerophilales bacterium]|nr:hypothetical protein [Candidatus Gastranaerophilales bacterium]